MWPKTTLPSLVAGPVAAKALQRIGFGAGFGCGAASGNLTPSSPVGRALSAGWGVSLAGRAVALHRQRIGLEVGRPNIAGGQEADGQQQEREDAHRDETPHRIGVNAGELFSLYHAAVPAASSQRLRRVWRLCRGNPFFSRRGGAFSGISSDDEPPKSFCDKVL